MSYAVSPEFDSQIEEIAQANHISPDEALDRIVRAGLTQMSPALNEPPPARTYASFYGVLAGRPGAHGSKEAVQRYLAELREE